MKTLQELYNEIIASDELKTAFAEAAKGGKTMEFLKAQGCEATVEELAAFLKDQTTGEISDELFATGKESAISVASGGIGCAILAGISAGTDIHKGGRLC